MSREKEIYEPALKGKKIPLLTLDNKWHKLFTQTESNEKIKELEEELNELIRRQGKLNTEIKEIKRLKKKLMGDIVSAMDESESGEKEADRSMEDNRRLIAECNEKIESYEDELLELPREIDQVNYRLMLVTMEICYDRIQENTAEIEEIAEWVSQIRVELKVRLIKKQEKELMNQKLYSYMHDIFGAEVIEIFDMKYEPKEQQP